MGILTGTPDPDTLTGGDEPDLILGLGAGDRLTGFQGSDTILGGPGDDTINGDFSFLGPYIPPLGEANLLLGGTGRDTITAGLGADTVLGGAGDDVLRGGIIDSLSGFLEGGASTNYTDDRADLMLGEAGNDQLDGANGSDTLLGGPGDDTLIGARGTDLLVGGRGHDVFLFAREAGIFGGPDTGVGPGMRDVILDFHQGQDLIDLSRLAFPFGSSPDSTEPVPVFLGEGVFEASFALQIRVVMEGAVTIVQFASGLRSADPDAAPEPPAGPSGEIELLGRHHLSEADFILI